MLWAGVAVMQYATLRARQLEDIGSCNKQNRLSEVKDFTAPDTFKFETSRVVW
jgi:hypothetical protein